MTTGAWIFMIIFWGIVLSLVTFCYSRTLRSDNNDTAEPEEPTVS
jgi:hypothetical protein